MKIQKKNENSEKNEKKNLNGQTLVIFMCIVGAYAIKFEKKLAKLKCFN